MSLLRSKFFEKVKKIVLRPNRLNRVLAFVVLLSGIGLLYWTTTADAQNKRRPQLPKRQRTVAAKATPTPTPQTPLLDPTTPQKTRERRTGNTNPAPPPSDNGNFEEPYNPPPLLVPETPAPGTVPTPLPTPRPRVVGTPTPTENTPVDEDEIVRVETDLTNVLFTATDKNRRFLTNLKQEDLRVFEDGQAQEIFTFTRQTDLPLSLALLIDTSASQERTLYVSKDAATDFVNAVLRPNKDELAVISFTGETTLEQGLTGNLERARRAIDRVSFIPPSGYVGGGMVVTGGGAGTPPLSPDAQRRAGSTAIWDAVYVVSDEVLADTPDRTRRAIILLTDGVDTSSRWKRQEAIDRAVKSDAVIYCIGIGDDFYGGVDNGSLRTLSERTGGRAFFPRNETDLRNAFAQIQDEMRSQYLVAYSSSNKNRDGSFRQVRLDIANPTLTQEKVKLTYRQGYYAKKR